jgi:hypothetical protein
MRTHQPPSTAAVAKRTAVPCAAATRPSNSSTLRPHAQNIRQWHGTTCMAPTACAAAHGACARCPPPTPTFQSPTHSCSVASCVGVDATAGDGGGAGAVTTSTSDTRVRRATRAREAIISKTLSSASRNGESNQLIASRRDIDNNHVRGFALFGRNKQQLLFACERRHGASQPQQGENCMHCASCRIHTHVASHEKHKQAQDRTHTHAQWWGHHRRAPAPHTSKIARPDWRIKNAHNPCDRTRAHGGTTDTHATTLWCAGFCVYEGREERMSQRLGGRDARGRLHAQHAAHMHALE